MPKRFVFSPVPKQSRQPARWRWLAPCTVSMLLSAMVHAQEAARCATSAASLDSLEGRVQWQGAGQSQWRDAHLHQTFCYGDTLLVQEKRAALRLSNNTLVRLNENSSLKLVPPEQSFWVELIAGAAHILTRTPKSFTVKAPYVNAAVEGTEFLVSAQSGINRVGVIEGVVRSSNAAGSVLLTQGQSTQTGSSSEAPSAPIMLKLNDFVSWAMYFPPLPGRANLPADLKAHLEKGEDGQVIKHISDNNQSSAEMLSLGAALALNRGQLAEAEQLNQRALTLNPKHPDAQSIAALIELGRGQLEPAKQRAAQNILDNPFNATAIIAHSYTQQAEGRLQAALDSALEAQRLTPNDSQIIARVAELNLSLGQRKPAEDALDKALTQAPNHSRLLTFKGFSLLAQRKAKAAQAYFVKASDLNSADPYAQLGWGMALIQRGKLEQGREHLELAVILDPANSVLRSYLGKGYFEEDKLNLADTQLNLAKTLDANDPTPWYYLSQVKHEQHKYAEALELIETSIDKNTNRAVYRDAGAIDSDAAARIADKARIYQAMGASQLAIATASDAIRAEPNDYPGHRAMAMALTGKEGSQTARANEALQASLLSPVGATPLAPGFGETALHVLPGAGPHQIGINEYNSVFTQTGLGGFFSALGAGSNTHAHEWQVQAVGGRNDFTVGQYSYQSDGFTQNNDRDYEINEARFKSEVTDGLVVHLSAISRDDKIGDVSESILKENLPASVRKNSNKDSYSLGFVYSPVGQFKVTALTSRKQDGHVTHFENVLTAGGKYYYDFYTLEKTNQSELLAAWDDESLGEFMLGFGSYGLDVSGRDVESYVNRAGTQVELVEYPPYSSSEGMHRQYFDYVFNGPNIKATVGAERRKVENYFTNSYENYYRGDLRFDCGFGFECSLGHDEFISLPTLARESIRYQLVNEYTGRTDYVPYSAVKLNFVSLAREIGGWSFSGGFQAEVVNPPPGYDDNYLLIPAPEFHEKGLSMQVVGSILGVDSLTLFADTTKVKTIYGEGQIVRAGLPLEADTQDVGVAVEERIYEGFTLRAIAKYIDQKFTYPFQLNPLDLHSRVRFLNMDISVIYEPTPNVSFRTTVINVLENDKDYIDDSPANFGSTGEAILDSFIAERIVAISARLEF